jgi:AraC-like DNA-binding protein
VHTLHTGSAFSRELSALPDLALKPGQDLFRYATQGHAMPVLDTSTDVEMTALLVTQNTLQTFIGAQAARQLLRGLGLARTCKVRLASIPLHVTQPLRECLSSGSVGSLHTLFAQSKVLEYLWKLATYVESCKPPEHLEPRELETIRTLHDYLMHLEGDMPTLKMLAQKFGESPQCLNQSFLREYGQSIYTMVSGHRLAQAHKALTETGVPIKAIATRLGYSHVNHFSHAFKVKFGYTPGSLRRPS